jgi:apolipoprotein N-acyltransferase
LELFRPILSSISKKENRNFLLQIVKVGLGWQPNFISLLCGIMVGVACPPIGLHYLSWLAFAIFGVVLLKEKMLSPQQAMVHFAAFSLGLNLVVAYWIFPLIGQRAGFGWIGTALISTIVIGVIVAISMLYGFVYGWCKRAISGKLHLWRGRANLGPFPTDVVIQAGFLWGYFVFWDSTEVRLFPFSPIQFSLESKALFAAVYYLQPFGLRLLLFGLAIVLAVAYLSLYKSKKRTFWSVSIFAIAICLGTHWGIGSLAVAHLKKGHPFGQPVALLQDNYHSIRGKERRLKESSLTSVEELNVALRHEAGSKLRELLDNPAEEPEVWVFWSETFFQRFHPEEAQGVFEGFGHPVDLQFVGYNRRTENPKEGKRYYNSVALFHEREGYLGSYHKNILFPIGEYIPFEREFPILRKWFPKWGNYSRGDQFGIFAHPDSNGPVFLVFTCYEGIFGFHTDRVLQAARKKYPKRDLIMVNPVNDFPFGRTSETIQHSMLTRFQAAKRGLPLVRVNGYGYSEIVSPWGETFKRTERDEMTVLTGFLPVKRAILRK